MEGRPAQDVRDALAQPGVFPGDAAPATVVETHASWVFLTRDRAYKLKKPIVLPFLDYGTPERRHALCREEVRVNRRLAPGIYLGVLAIAATGDGYELAAEDDPRAVDHVVEMLRFDERSTLAARLARGEVADADMTALGRTLARFHAAAPSVPVTGASAPVVERRLRANIHELLDVTEQRGEVERVLGLERFTHEFAVARAPTFEARARHGLVREGHGDLRAEHVVLGDGGDIAVVDGIEFDRALRELDVADDLAFLVMDLTARGGEGAARALVAAYRAAGGDPGDDALISFYACGRALVRAKVALLRAAQLPVTSAEHGACSAAARDLITLAERFAWRARLPLALVVCGVPASGKTHLATVIAAASGLAHLSSDVTRKRLAGLTSQDRAGARAYDPEMNHLTYRELGRLAAAEARERGGVIVDATFRHRADRAAFTDGFARAAPVLFVECQAPLAELQRRARLRERDPDRISDATLDVATREARVWDQLDDVAPAAHIALRSDRPADEVLADLLALLDRRIRRLTCAPPAAGERPGAP